MSQRESVDRLAGMDQPQTIVIGGGLAGLTAAATLVRQGRPVTVLEAAEHLGGRARTRRRDGFDLNLGPHALYRTGGGRAILRTLGVRPRGRMPRLHRAGFFAGGEVVPAWGQAARTRHTAGLLAAVRGLAPKAAAAWSGRPAVEWLDAVAEDGERRAILASVLRTATYSADLDLLDAGAATRQLRTAAHGVLYLHGGWGTLVDGLADVIRDGGGTLRTRAVVAAVEHDTRVRAVRLQDGTSLAASSVVLAVNDPRRVAALLEGPGAAEVERAVASTVPVRMAHLDVALRPLPAPRFPNVLGLDAPVYLTVQSDVATVAPRDGAVIHVGRYLRPDEEAGDHRAALEAALDAAQPGWRDHVVDARYVPRSMVCGDHARAATCGTAGRPPVTMAGVDGLAVAGDWVGPDGTLADAAIVSGHAAARAIIDGMVPSHEAVPA